MGQQGEERRETGEEGERGKAAGGGGGGMCALGAVRKEDVSLDGVDDLLLLLLRLVVGVVQVVLGVGVDGACLLDGLELSYEASARPGPV